ncbi:transcriptional regulator of RNA polII, SAGA, subunit-domain-containing protein [Clohesyomyces aquaticus]|uniref:Transcriptional regulator of RNA polII, SAGA, subunit-domain-containing protein n=1 Tax=Clohesyomyces aquaticus TaxID=1231657 RepID=A0A1Y1ZIT5_9PLEO|nr:transcriptional regulator of RNA polII, SAGA, subunit-domain-containing protein [Clohesyomyces aquaticus]
MATIRPDSISVNTSTTPILSNKELMSPRISIAKPEKRAVTAPRVDVEPLYTALKSSMGDAEWAIYKEGIARFLLGNLNQEELTRRLSPILSTSFLENTHNQFILGIYQNVFRDAPEPGVASWVSANDKPTQTGAKPNTGDEAEKRLKHEVMQLSRRERKRLKTVQDGVKEVWDPFTSQMVEYQDARRIKQPDTGPASAGGFQKTNWELEIRKHYTQPLFTETHEFPDTETISARMLPICYEYGLPSGHTPDCPSYMNIATETYIKEALSNLFARVSSNGPAYIKTADFKRRVAKEEDLGVQRSVGGMLPSEQEELRKRRPLCMEDLRIAVQLGDSYLGQVPLIMGGITNSRFLDTPGLEDGILGREERIRNEGPVSTVANSAAANAEVRRVGVVNGYGGASGSKRDMRNGWLVDLGEQMGVEGDGDEWGWQGGKEVDVDGLDGVLEGCLAVTV